MLLSQLLKQANINFDEKIISNDFEVSKIASLQKAKSNEISFITQKEYIKYLESTNAGAILLKDASGLKAKGGGILIEVQNPQLAMANLSKLFFIQEFDAFINKKVKDSSIDESATIMPNTYIGSNVIIGANSVIMPGSVISDNVIIGENCYIYPNVVIYHNCIIGNNVKIHAGSVIGVDSFGYATDKEGIHHKIYHNGIAVIADDVEIGANSTIGRAVLDKTMIKQGSKLGSLVEVSHNCIVGEHNLLVSQVGLAGSTTTDRNVVFGGQAGTGGHIHIGEFTQIAGRGAISKSLPSHSKYGGHPMMELNEWMKFYVGLKRLLKKYNDDKNK